MIKGLSGWLQHLLGCRLEKGFQFDGATGWTWVGL